jgi:lipopolysaccharide transport system ATP-binding protein
MSDIAIRVENLSKQYKICAVQQRYDTLCDQIADGLRSLLRRNGRPTSGQDTIWALKDVSFEVKQGEVVGIIGPNGAGKSTLLKILSRITEPTAGRAELYGSLGSLLEVGTGFHPELSGRENIYLNGAILGMRKSELDRKFDEIVTFAEIEKFIDTPVKYYSSGMYVRLAFAVAAHLEPDILIIDEVLAVGDATFQRKCLGKMSDVAKEGRTVLFVSHNMAAVKLLCGRAILLKPGQRIIEGSVDQVADAYLRAGAEMLTGTIPDDAPRVGTGEARIRSVQLTDTEGKRLAHLYLGQPFRVTLTFDVLTDIEDAVIEVSIAALDGTHVAHANTADGEEKPPLHFPRGQYTVSVDIDLVLLPRQYSFIVGMHRSWGFTIDFIERVLDFTVLNGAANGSDRYRWTPVRGYVRPVACWHIPELI